MNILVTGAKGFIGKNLVTELKKRNFTNIYEFDMNTEHSALDIYTKTCDFVFHLAGVNRPKSNEEYMPGNLGITSELLECLKRNNNKAPVLITSSIQAEIDNPYGNSKRASEEAMFTYAKETGVSVFVYRLPNVFGKWCKPNYNSAVATFCYNIATGLPIQVNDPKVIMNLVYIDDVINAFIQNLLNSSENKERNIKAPQNEYCSVQPVFTIKLGKIAELVHSFKQTREKLNIPDMSDGFTKRLYSTYLSYLPQNEFNYPLRMNVDERGSFTEFIKTPDRGQVSVNISKPNITKGNHWHHTKCEKFLVVSGKGVIRFRKIDCEDVVEYYVSSEKLEVIDIPPGYTHNIENLGSEDMVTIMWVNEVFNPEKPDTIFLEV